MDKLKSCFGMNNDSNKYKDHIDIHFGSNKDEPNKIYNSTNKTRSAKYTWYSWLPLSIIFQFTRAANIYFLIISILTAMPFSPKSPGSMIGTFMAVLLFTSLKELFEDIFRMISDKEVNNTIAMVLKYDGRARFEKTQWRDIKLGDIIRVEKDQTFP